MTVLFQRNRYLWVQFVGLAAVPLLLDVCLAGLASSRTAFGFPSAFGLQFWLIAAVSIVPPLVMQCLRPFYVFSVPPLALKPSVLTANQRRCLRLLESWQIKALAVVSAGLSLWLLSQLYARSPQITPIMTPNAGIISAVVAFCLVCTFLQISISSARLLLVGPEAMKRVKPYAPPAIASNFSILGLRVGKILPIPSDKVATDPENERITESESVYDQEAKTALAEPERPASESTSPELTEPAVIDTPPLEPPSEAKSLQPEAAQTVDAETETVAAEAELPIEETLSEPAESTETEPALEGQEADAIETDADVTKTDEGDVERL